MLGGTEPISIASYPAASGKIFVGTNGNGVRYSANFGDEFQLRGLDKNKTSSFAIDNLKNSIIYAGVEEGSALGVNKSTDDGVSWVNMSSGLDYPSTVSLAEDPAEPAIIYAATHSGSPGNWIGHCYVSVDDARQWTEITGVNPPFVEIYDLQIDYNQPNKVYAMTSDGQYDFANKHFAATPTGLYTYSPLWQFKALTSASSDASDYNSQRKIVREEYSDILHVVYHSGGSALHNIYYTFSSDGGGSWSPKVFLGEGKHPAIALDNFGYPHVVYLADDERTIYYVGNPWGSGWTNPIPIYAPGSTYTLGPPAFVTDPGLAMDRGHVIFHQVGSDPVPLYSIISGMFNPYNPDPIQPVVVDGPTPVECLNPALSRYPWANSLHAAWTRGDQVFYSEKFIDSPDPWSPPLQISVTSGSHSPNIDVYGDQAHVAWVEPHPIKLTQVTHRSKSLLTGNWNDPEAVAVAWDCSAPQMSAGIYCFWCQNDNGNWEVYYSWWSPDGWCLPINLSNTAQRSVSPQVTFRPMPMGNLHFCFWTEADAPPYQEYFVQVPGPLSPLYYLDAGQEKASPYTVHRGSYIQYTNRSEKTVDIDDIYLTYRFRHLNPGKLYLMKASYYHESNGSTGLEIQVDGAILANVAVPSRSVLRGEAWLPTELYADSVIELTIKKRSGAFGNLALLVLCEAEPQKGGKGGPQSTELSDLSIPKEFSLGSCYPNPMKSATCIAYALPKTSKVELGIYNISGQVVKMFRAEGSQAPGRYLVFWDGKDEKGHRMPGGIYFYRLSAGSFVATKKIVVIR